MRETSCGIFRIGSVRFKPILSPIALAALSLTLASACSRKPSTNHRQPDASVHPPKPKGPPLHPKKPLAPGFKGGTAWMNTSRPLTMADIQGRVTVVDFWTSCCINCIHTIPTLKRLKAEFSNDPFLVVGVHSPKFTAESGAQRLLSNLRSYGIRHPVVLDGNSAIWKTWGARSWPTVAVLDVDGRIVWADGGEPDYETLRQIVEKQLELGAKAHRLAKGPPSAWKPDLGKDTPLKFPGKITVGKDGELFVSDTGHHRILWFDKAGKLLGSIGSGLQGKIDGSFEQASFRSPQGLAVGDGVLYVADTENHLIRKVDLKTRKVSSIAGTGRLGRHFLSRKPEPALGRELRSPWGLWLEGKTLYVALAGSHQIGKVDLETNQLVLFAGSGRENIVDGEGDHAAFAQPSALASNGKELFVLDSETSAVRAVDLKTRKVRTLIGEGLFEFGDRDGGMSKGRLQHPLGMVLAGNSLLVADTYNSKLKRVPIKGGSVTTWYVGKGKTALFEPGGLAISGPDLLIADTHHHRILRTPWAKQAAAGPVALQGIPAAARGISVAKLDPNANSGRLDGTYHWRWRVQPGKAPSLALQWRTPEGTGINDEAPFRLTWKETSGLAETPKPLSKTGKDVRKGVSFAIRPKGGAKQATLKGKLEAVVCDTATHAVCMPVRYAVEAQVDFVSSGLQTKVLVPLPRARAQ